MNTPPFRRLPVRWLPFRRLLAAGALLAVSACAESWDAPRPMASISPLELVGLTVQSGDRILGNVEDVVLTPDRRAEQVLVASGAPVYPTKRRVAVDTGQLRYSRERQALILTGMSPEQFAALPDTVSGDRVMSVSPAGSTNWMGTATAPR